jgi:hypothetical protein
MLKWIPYRRSGWTEQNVTLGLATIFFNVIEYAEQKVPLSPFLSVKSVAKSTHIVAPLSPPCIPSQASFLYLLQRLVLEFSYQKLSPAS